MEPTPNPPLPYSLLMPAVHKAPVVLTSPHSGRYYPAAFLASSRLDATAIRRSEDSFVDELFAAGPALGVPLLAASFPRAYCDVNREAWELDPGMFEDSLPDYVNTASPRVNAGLGTIARIVGTGEPIYRRKLRFAEAEARILDCWQPFHRTLREIVDAAMQRFGVCLVIDCHSMPSTPGRRGAGKPPDVILGDVHGVSCSSQITGFFETKLRRLGLAVKRNEPYAGGFITRHYGRPFEGVHVLQIEFLRALYMDEAQFMKSDNFAALSGIVGELIAAIVDDAAALLANRDHGRLANAAE